MAMIIKLWHNEFEVEIHEHLATFYEPLPTKASETASPYCCYIGVVIFYEGKPGLSPEIDRVRCKYDLLGQRWTDEDLGWSALAPFVEHDGIIYELISGNVMWRNGQWQMRHIARRVREDDIRIKHFVESTY